jgi:hypothetical protein
MATKFAKFLEDNKIITPRLQSASAKIERLTVDDRAYIAEVSRKRSLAGRKNAASVTVEKKKLHSGRPVTGRLIDDASLGKPVSGAAKTRLLRAVNRILEQRKKPAVVYKDPF